MVLGRDRREDSWMVDFMYCMQRSHESIRKRDPDKFTCDETDLFLQNGFDIHGDLQALLTCAKGNATQGDDVTEIPPPGDGNMPI